MWSAARASSQSAKPTICKPARRNSGGCQRSLPMRVAAIYDIHGNLPALEAVLAEIEQAAPDVILVGGDVATGPMPKATLERLMGLGQRARFVRGNADREVVACFDDVPLPSDTPEEVQ